MFHTQRRVEFADTDAAGILHFAAFFRLMEQAEHELWRSLGLSVLAFDGDQTISWPRVHASCDFRAAVRFEDVLEIAVEIERLGETSVTFVFQFTCREQAIAKGRMTVVCCRLRRDGPPEPMPIPPAIRELLRPHLAPNVQ